MANTNRREWLKAASAASAGLLSATTLSGFSNSAAADQTSSDSLPMQLYKSLTDLQRQKVCLPIDHPKRQYVSNWWYIHPDYRIPNTFTADQQQLIKQIFDSMHSEAHQDAVNKQVLIDQYGEEKNAPAAAFFGTPEDANFEFLFTGHHVTRRCNAHTDKGSGFGGAPIFYGHYPHAVAEMRDNFREAKDHPGNPYWYQGKLFNKFVKALDSNQQAKGLVVEEPRSESPEAVVTKNFVPRGLSCNDLSGDQQKLLIETMRGMLSMFREGDVNATIASIENSKIVDSLHISWFTGKYDIGSDQVWDTWQIEGPDMVWYFRGYPHIHCYFHLKS
ncbi:MAG: DUF3500 domain-containing protein [Planctomycetales bacterium]|nr:DUF3500 domain-containing protein [Planctomycetales bacterium]